VQVEQYNYLPGMETLLQHLSAAGHEMHTVSNYPIWYRWIEEKLKLSHFLPWTFVSCEGPMQVCKLPCQVALPSCPCVGFSSW
jgi:FMN hydrolase / 5-amino-6-(5-phospho-D-ribitylamino)uracil phosphatase